MILSFKVQNFRSIYNEVTLDLTATNLTGKEATLSNFYSPDGYENLPVLKSAVVYGANASGKSNILKALNFFHESIINSTNLKLGDPIPFEPFRLFKNSPQEPSSFEMDFVANDGIRYTYGYKTDSTEVKEEYLSAYLTNRETKLFIRKSGEKIIFSSYFKGEKKVLEDQLLKNNLLLSKAANSNYEQMEPVYTFFSEGFNVFLGELSNNIYSKKKSFEDLYFKTHIQDFLKIADTRIDSFEIKKESEHKFKFPKQLPESIRENLIEKFSYQAEVVHLTTDDSKPIEVRWSMDEESAGTLKLFSLAGPIIDILNKGHILIFDEINNSLHPKISKFIVDLFNSEKTNPKKAQLIFTTQDTTLLNKDLFRRDQVWFTEKNEFGMTELYPLSSFSKKEVRWDIPFDKWYLSGRFGAIPSLQEFKNEPDEI